MPCLFKEMMLSFLMCNLKQGKIYKLTNSKGLSYYGSTTKQLSTRLAQHKIQFLNEKIKRKTKSAILFKEDVANVKIVLVEFVFYKDKTELFVRERWWIENNECVNKNLPNRNISEWRKTHKSKINSKQKNYYEKNKEQILKKAKEKYKIEKSKILEKARINSKKYYAEHKCRIKEKAKQKTKCSVCGSCVRKDNLNRHKKSKKCSAFVFKKNNI